MSALNKRATVYFDPDIHKALKIRAALTSESISEFIHHAVKQELAEDEEDIRTIRERSHEPAVPFEKVLKDLKSHGKI